MRGSWKISTLCVVLVGALAACSQPPAPAPQVKAPPPPQRDLVAEVRAAAADAGDVIDVQPLRDGAVEDLLLAAQRAESALDWPAAAAALERALQLQPSDPELLQRHAEARLALREIEQAERLAARSFEIGPKLGALCRRNWTLLRIAREERGDNAGAIAASQQLGRCVVEPPVRM